MLFGVKTLKARFSCRSAAVLERASGQSPGARGAGGVSDINHQQEWHAILRHNKRAPIDCEHPYSGIIDFAFSSNGLLFVVASGWGTEEGHTKVRLLVLGCCIHPQAAAICA